MASNDKTGWRCPICETVNTGDNCTICGTKIEQEPKIHEDFRNNRDENTVGWHPESLVADSSTPEAAEELQPSADKWKSAVAIFILAVIWLASIYAAYALFFGHPQEVSVDTDNKAYDGSNAEDERIVIEDNTDILFDDPDQVEQIYSQPDVVDVVSVGYCDDNYGLNKYGEAVFWEILIYMIGDLDSVKAVQASWTDTVSCINDSIYAGGEHEDLGWQSALNGNTHWFSDTDYDNDILIVISLPDDPSIAGTQYILLNNTKITFDLIYLGDYSTGAGWDCENIQY